MYCLRNRPRKRRETCAGEVGRAHRLGRDDQEGKHVYKPVSELPGAVCRRSQPEERRTHSLPPEQAYKRPEGAVAGTSGRHRVEQVGKCSHVGQTDHTDHLDRLDPTLPL